VGRQADVINDNVNTIMYPGVSSIDNDQQWRGEGAWSDPIARRGACRHERRWFGNPNAWNAAKFRSLFLWVVTHLLL
jgi:hypothetical protein